MHGDFSRNTFRPELGYAAVRLQQGRVSVDADWNEEGDIRAYLERTALTDVIGTAGTPEPGGFVVTVARDGTLRVGPGHYYVDGVLCENAEVRTLPAQPFLPDVALPTETGVYLAYLDVWERLVTWLRDPLLREVALDGPDTAVREQVIWQVRLERVGDTGDAIACSDFGADWIPAGVSSNGRLRAQAETPPPDDNECLVPPGAGYRRQENQLYRIEIHDPSSAADGPTYKWSRENGSVLTRLLDIDGDVLAINPPGRDDILGWSPGNWAELSDEGRVLRGEPGVMVQLGPVEGDRLTVSDWGAGGTLTMAAFGSHPTVRRWDSDGVLPLSTGAFLPIESGVEIEFDPDPAHADYQTGDHWSFPARTATGSVEWPLDAAGDSAFQPRQGTIHRYAQLALLSWDGTDWRFLADCRDLFPPLTDLLTLLHAGGDGQESLPGAPLARALRVAVFRGRFPVSGVRILFTASGAGQVAATSADIPDADATHEVFTNGDGIAACFWQLENNLTRPVQSLEARLLDAGGAPQPASVLFVGSLSLASGVFYQPEPTCTNLAGQTTVQTAVNRLARIARIFAVTGNGQHLAPGADAAPLQVIVGTSCGPLQGAVVNFVVAAGSGTLNGGTGPVNVTTNAQGIATVDWQPDTFTPFQAVNATLTGGFAAAAPPTVARFTASLRLGGGGNEEIRCSVTVGTNGNFATLRNALETLIQPDQSSDISICLTPGDHPVDGRLVLAPPDDRPWHVEITGSGRGSRLRIASEPIVIEGLTSFAMRHLDVLVRESDRPLQITAVGELTLEDCQLEHQVSTSAIVTVQDTRRIRFSDTTIALSDSEVDPATAVLALSDARADTAFDNCRFAGHVLLYASRFAPTDDNVFNQMARTSNGNELQLGRSQGNFRASSCQFRRIVVDAGFSNEIMQGNRPEPYRSCHLSNCLFVASLSQVLAAHITLDAGRFQPDNTDAILLTGVSTTAIYTGNASPNRGIRLVAGVPGGIAGSNIRHAANLFSLTNP